MRTVPSGLKALGRLWVLVLISTAVGAAPATAPVVAAGSPQAAAVDFMLGMMNGDSAKVFGAMYFADDRAKADAEALIGQALAEMQFQNALTKSFGEKPAVSAGDLADMKGMFAKAKVTLDGERAEVKCDPGPMLYEVKKGGVWLIDFARTQEANEPVDPVDVKNAAAEVKVYRDLIGEINGGRIASAAAARQELTRRKAALLPKVDNAVATKATQVALGNLRTALLTFKVQFDRYPTTAEGLKALVEKPASLPGWSSPFMEKMPTDGWGRRFNYKSDGTSYQLFSSGSDGKPSTADDVK